MKDEKKIELRKNILGILKKPPIRKIKCSHCSGYGGVMTGVISSKYCTWCDGTGKESIIAYRGWVNRIEKLISQ